MKELTPELLDDLSSLAALGWTDGEMAGFLGISERQLEAVLTEVPGASTGSAAALTIPAADRQKIREAVTSGRLEKRAKIELAVVRGALAGDSDSIDQFNTIVRDKSFSVSKLDLFGGAEKEGAFEKIQEYIASGSKGNLSDKERIYIDLLTLIYSLDGQYGKRRTIKFLTSPPFGIPYQRAADIYSEAVELFFCNRKVSKEAMRNKMADQFDTLYVAARDAAKTSKDYEVAANILANKARAELTRMYNEKEIGSQEEYDERIYQLEVATLTARLATRKDAGAARAKIENDLQDKVKKHSEDALKRQQENEKKAGELVKEGSAVIAAAETDKTKAALAAEETRYTAELKKFKDTKVQYENQAAVLEAIEKKHQNALLKIKQESWDRELSKLETKHNLEKEKIKSQYSSKIAQESPNSKNITQYTKERDYALIESDLEYLNELKSQLEKIKKESGTDGIKLPQEELDKYLLKLEQTKTKIAELTTQKNKSDGGIFSGTGKGSLFGVSQDQWNEFFANLKTGKDKAESLSIALNAVGGFAQEGFQLASKAIELTNAKENKAFKEYQKDNEKKKKALKSRYDDGLISQEQYNARVEEMEAEEEAKREEMEIKQAKRTKAMNLIQSIINTALSVTKTLAQWGWPAGAAPAAIVSAFGAAQTALIAAQPVGAEEGGFVDVRRAQDGKAFKARLSPDKRGFVSSPTVLVGENGGEYVIPAEGLSNPSLLPFVATLEEARKAGTLRSLNFEAVYPVGSAVGRENGGFAGNAAGTQVASTGSATGVGASTDSATDRKLLEAIELLNQRLSAPIKADVSMLGKNGIIEQTERYNRAKRRATYGK